MLRIHIATPVFAKRHGNNHIRGKRLRPQQHIRRLAFGNVAFDTRMKAVKLFNHGGDHVLQKLGCKAWRKGLALGDPLVLGTKEQALGSDDGRKHAVHGALLVVLAVDQIRFWYVQYQFD